jgi:hypothetical protein
VSEASFALRSDPRPGARFGSPVAGARQARIGAETPSRVTHAGANDTGGHRKLPDVTHRVLCAMYEATDDGRRKPGPSHGAKVAKRRHIDRPGRAAAD